MPQRRTDEIVATLEDMIIMREFGDGERLDEIKLATRFDVSRTPIREALQKLETSGLVRHVPRRGVFVHQPGPIELVMLFEAMSELEAACGRLAATRISDETLGHLGAANAKCHAAIEANDVGRYYDENERFHHLIYGASGNTYLEESAKRLHMRLRPFRRIQLQVRGRLNQSMAEHEAILTALAEGDSERAARELRGHVSVQGDKFHHLLATLQPAAE
ncbi:MAG: GntR family transcriptional regulator [Pseudomonadota bacterium]